MKLFLPVNTDLVCFTVVFICKCSDIDTFVVFMSPETLQVREWRSVLSGEGFKKQVVLVTVDKAHCIPEWLVRVSVTCPRLICACICLIGDKTSESHLR